MYAFKVQNQSKMLLKVAGNKLKVYTKSTWLTF